MNQTMLQDVSDMFAPDAVYLVGGAVRDQILGYVPKDNDFSTALTPDDIEARVRAAGRRPYLTGKRFGTVGFKLNGDFIEITSFRKEQYTKGSRKPAVEFVNDINHDLSRRDFTINAIAVRDGRYIDPFGGRFDILARRIKCVGLPKDRFREDALRMLRAARFASQLEFQVDQLAEATAAKMANKILDVSKERWVSELDKLLVTEKPSLGFDFLARTRLLNFMIPELSIQVGYDQNSPWHDLTLWEHTLATVDAAPNELELRWAALLHDVGKPFVRTNRSDRSNYIMHDLLGAEIANSIGLHLKWSNARIEKVSETIFYHLRDDSPIRAADNASKRREMLS